MNQIKVCRKKATVILIVSIFIITLVTSNINDAFIFVSKQTKNIELNLSISDVNKNYLVDGFFAQKMQAHIEKLNVNEVSIKKVSHTFFLGDEIINDMINKGKEDEDTFQNSFYATFIFIVSLCFIFGRKSKGYYIEILFFSHILETVIQFIHKLDGKKRYNLIVDFQ